MFGNLWQINNLKTSQSYFGTNFSIRQSHLLINSVIVFAFQKSICELSNVMVEESTENTEISLLALSVNKRRKEVSNKASSLAQ